MPAFDTAPLGTAEAIGYRSDPPVCVEQCNRLDLTAVWAMAQPRWVGARYTRWILDAGIGARSVR